MDRFMERKTSLDKLKSQVVAESIKQGLIKTNDKYPTTRNIQLWFRDYFEPEVQLTDIGSVLKKFSSGETEVFQNGLDGAVKSNSNSPFSGEESDYFDRKAHEYVNDRIGIVQTSSQVELSYKTNPKSMLNSSRVNLKHRLNDLITDNFTHSKHPEIERDDKSIKVPPLVLKHKLDDSITAHITKSNHTENECDCTHLNIPPLVPISTVCDIHFGENKYGNHAELDLNNDSNQDQLALSNDGNHAKLALNKDSNHPALTLHKSNKNIPGSDQKRTMAAFPISESQPGNGNQLNMETVTWNPKQCYSSNIKKTSPSGDKNIKVNCLDISFPGITDNKAIEKEIYNEVVEEMEAIKQKVINVNNRSTNIVGDISNFNHNSCVKVGASMNLNKNDHHQRNENSEFANSDLINYKLDNIIEVSANFDSKYNKQSSSKSEPRVIVNTDDLETGLQEQDQDKVVMCQEYNTKSPINDLKSEMAFQDNFAPTIISTISMTNSDFDRTSHVYTTDTSELDVPTVDSISVFDFTEEDTVGNHRQNITYLDILKDDNNRIRNTEKPEEKVGLENIDDNTVTITKDKQGSRKKHLKSIVKKHKDDRFVALSETNNSDKRSPISKSCLFGARLVIKQDKIVVQSPPFKYYGNADDNKDDNTDILKGQNVSHQDDNIIGNVDKINTNGINVTDNGNTVTYNSNNVNGDGNNASDIASNATLKGATDKVNNVDVIGKKVTHQSDATIDNNKGENSDNATSANSKLKNRSKPLKKRKLKTQVMDMLNENKTPPSINTAKQSDPPHNLHESHELNTPDKKVKELANHNWQLSTYKLDCETKNNIKENLNITIRRHNIQKLRRHSLNGVQSVNQGRNKARLKPGRNVYKKLKLRHRIGNKKYDEQSELSQKKKLEESNNGRVSNATTSSDIQKPGRILCKKLKLRHRIGDQKYVEMSELSPEKKQNKSNCCRVLNTTTGLDIRKEYREVVPVTSASYQHSQVNTIEPTLQGNDKTTQQAATMMPTLIPVTIIPVIANKTPTPLVIKPISIQNRTPQLQSTLTLQPIPSSLCPNSIQTNINKELSNVQTVVNQNPFRQQQLIRTAIHQPYVNAKPTNGNIPHPLTNMEQGDMKKTLAKPTSYIAANTQAVPPKSTYNTVTPNPSRLIAPAPKLLAIEPVHHAQPINPSMPRSPISASKHTGTNHNQSFKPMASITPLSSTVVGHSHAGPLKGQIVHNKQIVSLAATDAAQIIYSPSIENKNCLNLFNPIAVPLTDDVQLPSGSIPLTTSSAGPVQPPNVSNNVALQSNEPTSPAVPSKEHTRPQIATSTLAAANVSAQEQSTEAPSPNVSQVNMVDSLVAKDKIESFSHLLNIDEDQFDNLKKLVKEYKKLEILCLKLQELEEVKKKELKIVTQNKQSTIHDLRDIQKSLHIVTFKDVPMENKGSVKCESLVTPSINQLPLSEYELALDLGKQSQEDISVKITSKIASSTKQDIENENEIKVKENAEIFINGNNVVSGIIAHVNKTNITDQESNIIDSMIDSTEQSYKMKENQYIKNIPQNVIEINKEGEDIYTHHFVDNMVNQLLYHTVETVSPTSNDKQMINLDNDNIQDKIKIACTDKIVKTVSAASNDKQMINLDNDNIHDKIKIACSDTKQDLIQSSTNISDEGSRKEKLVQSTLSAAIGSPSVTPCRGRKRGRPRKHCYGHKYLKNDQKHEYPKNLQINNMRDSMLPIVFPRNPNKSKPVEPARTLTPEKSMAQSNHQVLYEHYSQHQHHQESQGRNQGYSNYHIQYRPPDDPSVPQRPPLHNVPCQPSFNIPRDQPQIHQNKSQCLTAQEEYWQNEGFQRGLNYQNPQQPFHRQSPSSLYPPLIFDYQSPRHQQVHTQCSPPGYNYPNQINPRITHERSGDNYQTSTMSYQHFLQQPPNQQPIAPRGPPSAHVNDCVIYPNQQSPNYKIVKDAERYRTTNYQHPQQQSQPAQPQPVVIEPQNQATQERFFQNQNQVMPRTKKPSDFHYQQRQFTIEYRPQDYRERHEPQGQHVQHECRMNNHQHRNSYAEAHPQIHKEPSPSPNYTVIPESNNLEPVRDLVSPNGQHIIRVGQNKPHEPVTYHSNLTGSIELNQQILPSGAIAAIIKTNSQADKDRIMMQSNQQYHLNYNIPYSAANLNIRNNPTDDITNKKPPPYQEVPNSRTTIINGLSIILSDDDDANHEDVNKAAADTGDKAKIRFFRCSQCDKEATFVCSGCKKTTYCSNQCQDDAWKSHFNDCAK